jgi:hypothetical protein
MEVRFSDDQIDRLEKAVANRIVIDSKRKLLSDKKGKQQVSRARI